MARTAVGILLLCAVAGCGGGGPDLGAPVSPEDGARICADFDAHAMACGWGNNLNEADWNCAEAASVWRADVFDAVSSCGIALACSDPGTPCLLLSVDAMPLAIHDQYAERCIARSAECNLTPMSTTQEVLLSCDADRLAPYSAPTMQSIIDCFDIACTSIGVCLDQTL